RRSRSFRDRAGARDRASPRWHCDGAPRAPRSGYSRGTGPSGGARGPRACRRPAAPRPRGGWESAAALPNHLGFACAARSGGLRTVPTVKVLHVVGARSNFMKVAPVLAQLRKRGQVRQVLVHTGQHYDAKMSDVIFQDLGMPQPDVHLGVGSGSHAQQTARVMIEVEPVLAREMPEVVVVAGDVNSTVAVALVAAKMGIP